MNVREIIGNQCIWLFPDTTPQRQDNVKALSFVQAIESRYGFYQGPRSLQDFNLAEGLTFLNGQFNQDWIIDKFQIFNNGALVEAKVTTDELEVFLHDVNDWAREFLNFPKLKVPFSAKYFLSQVEVQLDFSLDEAMSFLSSLNSFIGETIRSYGQKSGQYGVTSMTFHCDLLKTQAPAPGANFLIARRLGHPFEENIYLASAPLRSADHLRALALLTDALSIRASTGS